MNLTALINKEDFLAHWQGHRALTRRVIEVFPEKELFEFSLGGMRPFSELVIEMSRIAVPGLEAIVSWKETTYQEELPGVHTKEELLAQWDEDTVCIDQLFGQIPEERFGETFNLFGLYNFPVVHNLWYAIDNEIHHRGQGYVYLRALGITPPFFWER